MPSVSLIFDRLPGILMRFWDNKKWTDSLYE